MILHNIYNRIFLYVLPNEGYSMTSDEQANRTATIDCHKNKADSCSGTYTNALENFLIYQ